MRILTEVPTATSIKREHWTAGSSPPIEPAGSGTFQEHHLFYFTIVNSKVGNFKAAPMASKVSDRAGTLGP